MRTLRRHEEEASFRWSSGTRHVEELSQLFVHTWRQCGSTGEDSGNESDGQTWVGTVEHQPSGALSDRGGHDRIHRLGLSSEKK